MAPRKAAAKTEEVNTAVPVETAVETLKSTSKKTAAKKTASTRKTAPKEETVVEVFVEYHGVQVPLKEVIENVKTNNVKAAKEIRIYLKPEDNAAYYVADGKENRIKVYFC